MKFMKGNEALAEAAIRAGINGYFGYPITPQSEIMEYLAREKPKYKYTLIQAESEIGSVNMMYGASGCGARCMTSTSGPGFSLMQEGISYIACAELPTVFVNVQRGGPGLGTIQASQGDYFQSVKGGGHGDYKLVVLGPNSVQEMVDLTTLAFDLADKYRTPVLILADGAIGQMMERVEFSNEIQKYKTPYESFEKKPWATIGKSDDRDANLISSLYIEPEQMEQKNIRLSHKYNIITDNEIRYEDYLLNDAEIVITAFGISSRIAKKVVDMAREDGIKLGLLRPITLWPFPSPKFEELSSKENIKFFISLEMNMGQMVEDVKLSVNGKKPVYFYGRAGGMVPTPDEVLAAVKSHI